MAEIIFIIIFVQCNFRCAVTGSSRTGIGNVPSNIYMHSNNVGVEIYIVARLVQNRRTGHSDS